jgi:hypothetical protein
MQPVIEITTFKLAKGLRMVDFIAANADVDPWLRGQPGFLSRMLLQQEDGTVMDMVVWERETDARDSARRLMRELADSPVHAAIDQRTVHWSVCPVVHTVP